MPVILIIEDEHAIVDIISFNLNREGFIVQAAYDGPEGLKMALNPDVDLVLLDVMLPGMDGFTLLRALRKKSSVPVLMVTAREEERDKVLGLETGADDYITKPFSVKELVARVKANIRRREGDVRAPSGDQITFGPFVIDKNLQTVRKNGEPLELTQREYELMLYFISSSSRVITREELMEKVWGFDYYGDLRAIDVSMRRLREKLEDDPSQPKYILTKRGSGYFIKEK